MQVGAYLLRNALKEDTKEQMLKQPVAQCKAAVVRAAPPPPPSPPKPLPPLPQTPAARPEAEAKASSSSSHSPPTDDQLKASYMQLDVSSLMSPQYWELYSTDEWSSTEQLSEETLVELYCAAFIDNELTSTAQQLAHELQRNDLEDSAESTLRML